DSATTTDQGQALPGFSVGAGSGRWVTGESVKNLPTVPVMTPGDHLTLGFYSAANNQGSCQQGRGIEEQFLPNDGAIDQYSMVNQALTYQPTRGNIQVRTLVFPYRFGDAPASL